MTTPRPEPRPTGRPSDRLLTPENSVLLFVDHQPQMAFAVQSHDRQLLLNNTAGLAKAARAFGVPAVLTSVAATTFSGPLFRELTDVFPGQPVIDRTTMNAWEDPRVVRAVAEAGRPKLVISGLWTEVCIVMPALCALDEGYEVYVVADACGAVSLEAHERAMDRMVQAGAQPVTWLQVLLEYQRDWARMDTYAAVGEVVLAHGGAYGIGSLYSAAMLHGVGEGTPQTDGARGAVAASW
jgi:nicotinamidase-related amidase